MTFISVFRGVVVCFLFSVDQRAMHAFPTRRSSDLRAASPCSASCGSASRPTPRPQPLSPRGREGLGARGRPDRKSTRLNSSHSQISYAVFCLKKKKENSTQQRVSTQEH